MRVCVCVCVCVIPGKKNFYNLFLKKISIFMVKNLTLKKLYWFYWKKYFLYFF